MASLLPDYQDKLEEILSLPLNERTESESEMLMGWFRQASTLFKALDSERLDVVIQHATMVHLKNDHVIFHQGEDGTCFYVILRGVVTVHAKKCNESENAAVEPVLMDVSVARGPKERARFGTDLCKLYAGRCFGELSVIGNRERNASVISDEPCVLIKFGREVYDKFISEYAAEELLQRSYYVSNHPLFRSWSVHYRDLLTENLHLKHYKFGEEIFRQGDKIEAVYFVSEGQVKLTINPSTPLEEYSKLLSKRQILLNNEEQSRYESGHLYPFKNLSIIERRKLRREEGFFASEQRYREISICIVGNQGLIGDIEAILGLPTYTVTAMSIQELELYEVEKASFVQLILKKNAESYEKMRESVHEKIEFRNQVCEGGLPIYNALLTFFQKAQPKDSRKQILKTYDAKRKSKKIVNNSFFSEMSKGRTHNRPQEKNDGFNNGKGVPMGNINEGNTKDPVTEARSSKDLLSVWRNTARHVIIRKKNQNEALVVKQFSAIEYKTLKKKMHALGKSTLKGGWSK